MVNPIKNFIQNYLGNKYDLSNYSFKRTLKQSAEEEDINVSKFDFEIESEVKKRSYLQRITDQIDGITEPKAKKYIQRLRRI